MHCEQVFVRPKGFGRELAWRLDFLVVLKHNLCALPPRKYLTVGERANSGETVDIGSHTGVKSQGLKYYRGSFYIGESDKQRAKNSRKGHARHDNQSP